MKQQTTNNKQQTTNNKQQTTNNKQQTTILTLLYSLTILGLLVFTITCSKNNEKPTEPCKDGVCLTDEQLTFFNTHIPSITTKKELYGARSLNLTSKGITSLEAGIFNNLSNLEWLSLFNNDLSSLPEGIDQLTNLTELLLGDNALIGIPAGIEKLTNLTILLLSGNQLSSLPAGIVKLTNLTALHLNGNNLTGFPDGIFTKLTKLTQLHFAGNNLTGFPDGIDNLTNLTQLYLEENQIPSLPAGIFTNLTNLITLRLKVSGSTERNSFTCNDTNYTTWGIVASVRTSGLTCND